MKPIRRTFLGTLALLALLGVFYLYSRADFLVQMANQLWTCF